MNRPRIRNEREESSSPPLFDGSPLEEYSSATMRRVKPLPKRRRTLANANTTESSTNDIDSPSEPAPLMFVASSNDAALSESFRIPGLPPLTFPDGTADGLELTTEQLLAHADKLQEYYLPILDAAASAVGINTKDILPAFRDRDRDDDSNGLDGDDYEQEEQGNGHEGGAGNRNTKKRKVPVTGIASKTSLLGDVEDVDTDTPAPASVAASASALSHSRSLALLRLRLSHSNYHGSSLSSRLTAATLASLQQKEMLRVRKKQLRAVLGVLESSVLKSNANRETDMMALDQAIEGLGSLGYNSMTSVYRANDDDPLASLGLSLDLGTNPKLKGSKAPKVRVRLSKRGKLRVGRVKRVEGNEGDENVPASEFTFVCHSATTDRLTTNKTQVAALRRRFQDELTRQASLARQVRQTRQTSKTGAVSSSPAKGTKGTKTSKASRQKQKRDQSEVDGSSDPATNTKPSNNGDNPSPTNSEPLSANGTASPTSIVATNTTANPSVKSKKSKTPKKKRSALANASNPHHLRNYVPSRVPYANTPTNSNTTSGTNMNGGWNGGGDPNDLLSPFPWRFLTAEIPERGKRQSGKTSGEKKGMKNRDQNRPTSPMTTNAASPVSAAPGIALTNSAGANANATSEWLCVFCEYELFFGDEGEYRRVLKRRKGVLKRRKRARDRARDVTGPEGRLLELVRGKLNLRKLRMSRSQ
ncbi:hypothetical protein BDP27DRAFT_239010 [Rhodocollybia butyracea]|uniref:Uncharacterized protein n=1 Tax=Rhodocollybia butyracea TaxID=206335 RepID=A0A9P5U179_9AGAR|nr:hypothetical protein BDP27DRAFT_239010 [Rhodocollybia butyracea]